VEQATLLKALVSRLESKVNTLQDENKLLKLKLLVHDDVNPPSHANSVPPRAHVSSTAENVNVALTSVLAAVTHSILNPPQSYHPEPTRFYPQRPSYHERPSHPHYWDNRREDYSRTPGSYYERPSHPHYCDSRWEDHSRNSGSYYNRFSDSRWEDHSRNSRSHYNSYGDDYIEKPYRSTQYHHSRRRDETWGDHSRNLRSNSNYRRDDPWEDPRSVGRAYHSKNGKEATTLTEYNHTSSPGSPTKSKSSPNLPEDSSVPTQEPENAVATGGATHPNRNLLPSKTNRNHPHLIEACSDPTQAPAPIQESEHAEAAGDATRLSRNSLSSPSNSQKSDTHFLAQRPNILEPDKKPTLQTSPSHL
jgi:hypothetical protein